MVAIYTARAERNMVEAGEIDVLKPWLRGLRGLREIEGAMAP